MTIDEVTALEYAVARFNAFSRECAYRREMTLDTHFEAEAKYSLLNLITRIAKRENRETIFVDVLSVVNDEIISYRVLQIKTHYD